MAHPLSKTGPIVAFWLGLACVLFAAFTYLTLPDRAAVNASGDLVVPRAPDGHFYVDGSVNGLAVKFLVDTGASSVSVSEAFALEAGLKEGTPTTFVTANGTRAGRVVRGVPVAVGPLSVGATTVGVGLTGPVRTALLGQSFLKHFRLTISNDTLLLQQQ